MLEIVIGENQLNLIKGELSKQTKLKLAEEKWKRFSEEEKEFVVEFLKVIHPKKSKLLKENRWYNTVGDIVGIFDPTGVVDLVNGISYLRQGDTLFGFLSIVSAVPYAGDLVAKPVMAALKLGKPSAKALNSVMKTAKAGDTAKAGADLAKLVETDRITNIFVKGMETIGPKLTDIVNKVPGGFMTRGLKNTILGWIDLFSKAGRQGKTVKQTTGYLARRIPKMSPEKAVKELEKLSNIVKSSPGAFTGYRTTKGLMSWKTIFGGMPQLMGRNKSVRALMRQSKWWLGFLDYLGLGNWVGPEELAQMVGGEEEMRRMMENYNRTSQARQNFEDQFGAEEQQQQYAQPSQPTSSTKSSDPFANFLRNIFIGQLNPM
jgi:hypothetical protein